MKRRVVGLFYLFILMSLSEAQTDSIRREIWTGISGSTISSLTSNSRFPLSPNDTALITGYFESLTNWNDNYGTRIRGYVHPPVTGNYIFWVSGNDNCELWLSTDDKQSHKTLIASVLGYIGEREWTKYAQQQSAAIPLVAGKRYYIEGLHKEATNSDNFAVGWQIPGGSYERPIPASRLSPTLDDDDYSLWTDTTRITMNTTISGADISNNVTNIPILVRLNESNFDFRSAAFNGTDIRFAKADGTHLYYQIENWDTLSREASIWVKIDTVYANNNTQYFTMIWGRAGAVNRSNGSAVFDSSNGYRGVWHLNQTPPNMSDASRQQNNGTAQGAMNSANVITGIIGKGIDFDGTDDYISTAVSFNNPTIFTISTWFKTTTNNGGKLIGFGNQQVGQSQNYDRNLWLDPSGHVHFGIYSSDDERTIGTTSTFNDGQWHQACAQLSSSGMNLFVDGTLRATNNSYTIPENFTGYWRIGYDNMTGWPDAPNSFYIQGALDEATVSYSVRSESWVKLNYESQKIGSSLLSFNNGKPVVSLNQLVEALPESSLTAQAFSIVAALGTSKSSSTNIQVKLNYFGNAQNGIDYDPLQSSYSLIIPADSTLAPQVINLTPIEDLLDEGNETLYVTIVPDTAYRVGNEDTIAIVITDNDQKYPPVILKEPADTSALTGDVASFSVEVSGSTPLTYQWTMNGIPVGTSSSTLITPPVSMNDSGAHIQCIITNSVGADTTRVATLYVSVRPEAPVIVRQPQTVTVAEGEYATFSVAVAGTPPFTYQWYNDSALVSGAVDSSIRVGPVTKNDNNSRYYCRVSNSVTDMISWKAILTVRKPSSQILVITGELYTSDLHAIGSSSTATMDFTVKLFPSMTSDSLLYSESFLTQYNQAIKVTDGKFSIRLGEGNATGDLVDIVRSNSNIFVSFSISRPGGNPETLNRRVPLTASPYALSSLPQILKGNVEPNNAAIEAPIGTHYLQTSTGDTYIRTLKSWIKLGN